MQATGQEMVSGHEIEHFGMVIIKSGSKSDREYLAGVKVRFRARDPKTLYELEQYCKDKWSKIPVCKNLICNYKKRLLSVITTKGHAIDY